MFRLVFLQRSLHRGLLNLRRGRGIASSLAALLGIVFIVQIVLVLGLSARGMRDALAANSVFSLALRLGATDRDVQEFLVAARQLPFVSSVDYVTREKTMELERAAHPDVATLLESGAVNPFRDTAVIALSTVSAFDEFSAFVRHPRWNQTLDTVAFSSLESQKDEFRSALLQAQGWNAGGMLLLALAGVALLLIVAEFVRRAAMGRREDLFVERMSGVEEASIVLPFATEMAVLLGVALLVSVPCVALLASAKDILSENMLGLFAIECVAVILFALVGAMMGIRRVQSPSYGTLSIF